MMYGLLAGRKRRRKFPMLSSALAAGLGHPNCRHIPPLPKPDPDEEDEDRPTPEQNDENSLDKGGTTAAAY
jgi:hypothetical protein